MKVISDWNSSLIKINSGKKTNSSTSSIRRKLERIKQKIRAGVRLSASEKAFLRKYAPELYMKAIAQEQQEESKESMKNRRLEEKANQEQDEKVREQTAITDEKIEEEMIDSQMQAMDVKEDIEEQKQIDKEMQSQKKEKQDNMEAMIDKEQEIARQLEAIIKEESMEKSIVKDEEEEKQDYEVRSKERKRLVKEFEADVAFRTKKPVLAHDTSERIPALVQGRAAYQTIAGAGRPADSDTMLRPRKA